MNTPTTINTNERIFQIETFDGEIILVNTKDAQQLIKEQNCKRIKHYWNYKFQSIGKDEVLQIKIN